LLSPSPIHYSLPGFGHSSHVGLSFENSSLPISKLSLSKRNLPSPPNKTLYNPACSPHWQHTRKSDAFISKVRLRISQARYTTKLLTREFVPSIRRHILNAVILLFSILPIQPFFDFITQKCMCLRMISQRWTRLQI
jgi:hypothetical protein